MKDTGFLKKQFYWSLNVLSHGCYWNDHPITHWTLHCDAVYVACSWFCDGVKHDWNKDMYSLQRALPFDEKNAGNMNKVLQKHKVWESFLYLFLNFCKISVIWLFPHGWYSSWNEKTFTLIINLMTRWKNLSAWNNKKKNGKGSRVINKKKTMMFLPRYDVIVEVGRKINQVHTHTILP